LDIRSLPTFKDIPWRWLIYASSVTLLAAIAFAFIHEVELKQDVSCEVVSSSELKLHGYAGVIGTVYVQPGQRVAQGAPLFQVARDPVLADALSIDIGTQTDTIVAPRAGVVVSSSLLPGRRLDPAEVALVIDTDPTHPLTVVLRVSSRQRGFIKQGQIIHLKLDAFPYARFGTYEARVDAISATPLGGLNASWQAAATSNGSDDYLAWATLPSNRLSYGGQSLQILPGMRGRASIVVERRTIAEWVLAPLFRMIRG